MREGNKKARNALKYLVRWEVANLTQPRKKAFRVNRTYPKIVRNRKQRIARRLDAKRRWSEQPDPMMSGSNIHFELIRCFLWVVWELVHGWDGQFELTGSMVGG